MPTIVLGELYSGAYHLGDPTDLLQRIEDLLENVNVLDFDHVCSKKFGQR
ncbi:MAG TPA: hypothetical protein VFR18_25115 [Terriglobia bacterium]|nr:hypothetical protein [Terriglobia bacterium]